MAKTIKKSGSLSTKAMLVHMTVSQWSGRKQDKEATESVMSTFQASKAAGAYHKKLLPKSAEFEKVNMLSAAIRRYFHEQTLPWLGDGTRIISSKNYLSFAKEMGDLKSKHEAAVKDFVKAYPSLVIKAKSRLGNLHKEGEYPDKNDIASKFGVQISFLPLPDAKDFRVKLSEKEIQDFNEKIKAVEDKAKQECFDRLKEVVSKARAKLSKPDMIFRDSLLGNIKDLCELMPKLNVTEDPWLDETVNDLQKIDLDPAKIRKDSKVKADAAKKLKAIESKMQGYMK